MAIPRKANAILEHSHSERRCNLRAPQFGHGSKTSVGPTDYQIRRPSHCSIGRNVILRSGLQERNGEHDSPARTSNPVNLRRYCLGCALFASRPEGREYQAVGQRAENSSRYNSASIGPATRWKPSESKDNRNQHAQPRFCSDSRQTRRLSRTGHEA